MLLFYLKNCPYCKRALAYIEQAKAEYPELSSVDVELVEESERPDVAGRYDYYYVPTFFLGGEKLHEGAIDYDQTVGVLRRGMKRNTNF